MERERERERERGRRRERENGVLRRGGGRVEEKRGDRDSLSSGEVTESGIILHSRTCVFL